MRICPFGMTFISTPCKNSPTGIFAALLLTFVLLISACENNEQNQADIVLVTLDTTRWDFLHSYGYDLPNSPTLDHLAAQGTLEIII
jgi:glucan phosphoethanolaminetransferase (alkaline phosphatase superfamily)